MTLRLLSMMGPTMEKRLLRHRAAGDGLPWGEIRRGRWRSYSNDAGTQLGDDHESVRSRPVRPVQLSVTAFGTHPRRPVQVRSVADQAFLRDRDAAFNAAAARTSALKPAAPIVSPSSISIARR